MNTIEIVLDYFWVLNNIDNTYKSGKKETKFNEVFNIKN